jgi:hypothetical protein
MIVARISAAWGVPVDTPVWTQSDLLGELIRRQYRAKYRKRGAAACYRPVHFSNRRCSRCVHRFPCHKFRLCEGQSPYRRQHRDQPPSWLSQAPCPTPHAGCRGGQQPVNLRLLAREDAFAPAAPLTEVSIARDIGRSSVDDMASRWRGRAFGLRAESTVAQRLRASCPLWHGAGALMRGTRVASAKRQHCREDR